ncbi:hypothetical protein T01_7296 [Trichinella spiralis]|uniref:Uncharacterized protein n=1 Tax=Trichinella spiralis TaxID=6334 RepID=A0A0V1BJ07_TRISP|nr:hypothetical protein T01_7296 [Trichinella spiralis]
MQQKSGDQNVRGLVNLKLLFEKSDEGAFSSLSMLDRHQRLKNGDLSDNCFSKLTKLYLISAND